MTSTTIISRQPSYASFSTQYSFEPGLELESRQTTPLDDDDDQDYSGSSSDSDDDQVDEKPRLGNDISRCLDKSEFDSCDFLPEGHIDELVTEEAVRQFLSYRPPKSGPLKDSTVQKVQKVVNYIFAVGAKKAKGAKRLLAIVILVGLTGDAALQALHRFARASIDDGSLPIRNPEESLGFRKKNGDFHDPWDKVKINNFCRDQWRVMAHVFTREDSQRVLKLDGECILPIVSQSEIGSAHGAFGWVKRVTLHENHHLDPITRYDGTRADVALKDIILPGDQREWEREAEAHIKMRGMRHNSIIEFIAAIEKGNKRYLLFQWAEEGNLRNFWSTNRRPTLSVDFVRDAVYQIRGLADALNAMHGGKESFRHGDLKPENILCVTRLAPVQGRVNMPQLKISDLGLAKHHMVATEMRPPTSQRCTTTRYEPPEVIKSLPLVPSMGGRSRRYDMWSLGCVILETVVWLLFGNENLEKFNSEIVDEHGQPNHWFQKKKKQGSAKAVVHRYVRGTITALLKDQECVGQTAIGDLVRIVKDKLLVVELGGARTFGDGDLNSLPTSLKGCRVYSHELMQSLDAVVKRCEDDKYCFTGKNRDMIRNLIVLPESEDTVAISEPSFLSPGDGLGPYRSGNGGREWNPSVRAPGYQEDEGQISLQIDKTEFPLDNPFAKELLTALGTEATDALFPKSEPTRLCGTCAGFDVWEPRFHVDDRLEDLEASRRSCDFCHIRWKACRSLRRQGSKTVRFHREQSMLHLNESLLPVLSLCRSPDLDTHIPESRIIQIGLPEVPPPNSSIHFDILRHWLHDCDTHHPSCRPTALNATSRPPTRLVEVGTKAFPLARLVETTPGSAPRYLALSHPWGAPPHYCTIPANLSKHLAQLPVNSPHFPATFRDAIAVTRELGLPYLWVDSLCIVQGYGGDFDAEAQRMEDVFAGAYCVLAASGAKGQADGFLRGERERRATVKLRADEDGSGGLWVGSFMDDFGLHVLQSPLSKRGWVLQERALARRTIYFTGWQAYWECGEAVRCETMTRVYNKLASFLGDPNFPSKLSGKLADRGEKIRFYEDLYRQYSRLDFTRITDRSIAVVGLEQRMVRDFKAWGGYGVFDDKSSSLLPRSLLWRRTDPAEMLKPLRRILPESHLPSWSWMAYDGPIDYLDVPFGEVDWFEGDIWSPWSGERQEPGELRIAGRYFLKEPVAPNSEHVEFELVLDDEDATTEKWEYWRCMLAGRRKAKALPLSQRTHYILIVAQVPSRSGEDASNWERIGVGMMPGEFISDPVGDEIVVY
ncbi:HET-domain-containing protein [Podospora conica]|nr:HET-domain-containing protein [Schizothecium conicum]